MKGRDTEEKFSQLFPSPLHFFISFSSLIPWFRDSSFPFPISLPLPLSLLARLSCFLSPVSLLPFLLPVLSPFGLVYPTPFLSILPFLFPPLVIFLTFALSFVSCFLSIYFTPLHRHFLPFSFFSFLSLVIYTLYFSYISYSCHRSRPSLFPFLYPLFYLLFYHPFHIFL